VSIPDFRPKVSLRSLLAGAAGVGMVVALLLHANRSPGPAASETATHAPPPLMSSAEPPLEGATTTPVLPPPAPTLVPSTVTAVATAVEEPAQPALDPEAAEGALPEGSEVATSTKPRAKKRGSPQLSAQPNKSRAPSRPPRRAAASKTQPTEDSLDSSMFDKRL
jgi:hypothetical protein